MKKTEYQINLIQQSKVDRKVKYPCFGIYNKTIGEVIIIDNRMVSLVQRWIAFVMKNGTYPNLLTNEYYIVKIDRDLEYRIGIIDSLHIDDTIIISK